MLLVACSISASREDETLAVVEVVHHGVMGIALPSVYSSGKQKWGEGGKSASVRLP